MHLYTRLAGSCYCYLSYRAYHLILPKQSPPATMSPHLNNMGRAGLSIPSVKKVRARPASNSDPSMAQPTQSQVNEAMNRCAGYGATTLSLDPPRSAYIRNTSGKGILGHGEMTRKKNKFDRQRVFLHQHRTYSESAPVMSASMSGAS
jgi:hypothetical protein